MANKEQHDLEDVANLDEAKKKAWEGKYEEEEEEEEEEESSKKPRGKKMMKKCDESVEEIDEAVKSSLGNSALPYKLHAENSHGTPEKIHIGHFATKEAAGRHADHLDMKNKWPEGYNAIVTHKSSGKQSHYTGDGFESLDEETLAASSLHPAARSISDPMSKISMIHSVIGHLAGMGKDDLTHWFNATMAQFGPGKDHGVGDHAAHNVATIDSKLGAGPKTAYPMPHLNVKEDVEEMFAGQDLSEEFKENVSTLFEAAVSARVIAEQTRLEEEYETKLAEEIAIFNEEVTSKLDAYLDYVVENWMKENEVAIESTLRNELTGEFIEGLKNLFAEHYIEVPENKVDVLEAMAEKVNALEEKLDESISENAELKSFVVEIQANEIFEELASDLALTQKDKFSALAEGISFDGDLDVYAKKLMIVKENYFKNESTSYSSNIEEETFEGEVAEVRNVDPSVGRYVQALSRTVKTK